MARDRTRHADPEETPPAAASLDRASSRPGVCEPPEPFHPALRHLVRLLAQELAQVEKKIAGLLSAIEDGMYHSSMKEKMAGLEDRKRSLTAQVVEAAEPAVLRMHPSLGDLYRQKIGDLVSALSDPEVRVQAAEAMRSLISEIRMVPAADAPDGHRIEFGGDLAGILALGEADTTKPPRMARAWSVSLVAGAGNRRFLPDLICAV